MQKKYISPNTYVSFKFLISFIVSTFLGCFWFGHVAAEEKNSNPTVIKIDDIEIKLAEYQTLLNEEIRNSFYHSRVAAEEKEGYHLKIANKIIDRYLMLEEVKRRKIAFDSKLVAERVEAKIKQMDSRYQNDKNWDKGREEFRQQLTLGYQQNSQIEQLTAQVRNIKEPSLEDIQAYYTANPDKFMAPVQQRVSVIILGVPPSSNNQAWDSARALAKDIKQKLDAGESFATLAEIHSTDISAEMGGDMGSVHKGTLGKAAQKVLDALQPGEVSDPITLLEGIALLKLTERIDPKLNTFERVKSQATRLLREERSELAWKQFIFTLRQAVKITIDEERLKKLIL